MSYYYSAQVVYAVPRKLLTEEELEILENEDECYISTGYDDQQLVGYVLNSVGQCRYVELESNSLSVPEDVHPIIKKYNPKFYLCVGVH